jgi:hypothetical protein
VKPRFVPALIAFLALAVPLAQAAPVPAEMADRPAARLRTLDKITARTSTMTLGVGKSAAFGSLTITLRACKENPPTEAPESAAFIEVQEVKGEQAPVMVFSGWMFASSPALSAMEHPVYDVWVLGCANAE